MNLLSALAHFQKKADPSRPLIKGGRRPPLMEKKAGRNPPREYELIIFINIKTPFVGVAEFGQRRRA